MGSSIAVGFPVWQSVASPFFSSVMELELPPEVPRRVFEGNLVAEQHDRIARWFLEETTADTLLVLEQDHRFPRNLLERVAEYGAGDWPIVGALYYSRMEPFFAVALVPRPPYWEREGVWEGQWEDIELTPLWPSLEDRIRGQGLQRVCAVGMGCMAIQRHVLEDWPKDEPFFTNWYGWGRFWTDDVRFCGRAAELGFPVYVDGDLELPHMGLRDVDHRTHRAHLERRATQLGLPRG